MENFISSVTSPIRVKFVEQVLLSSFELLLQLKSSSLWKMKEILICWWWPQKLAFLRWAPAVRRRARLDWHCETFQVTSIGATKSKCFKIKIISEYTYRSLKSWLTLPQSLSSLTFWDRGSHWTWSLPTGLDLVGGASLSVRFFLWFRRHCQMSNKKV